VLHCQRGFVPPVQPNRRRAGIRGYRRASSRHKRSSPSPFRRCSPLRARFEPMDMPCNPEVERSASASSQSRATPRASRFNMPYHRCGSARPGSYVKKSSSIVPGRGHCISAAAVCEGYAGNPKRAVGAGLAEPGPQGRFASSPAARILSSSTSRRSEHCRTLTCYARAHTFRSSGFPGVREAGHEQDASAIHVRSPQLRRRRSCRAASSMAWAHWGLKPNCEAVSFKPPPRRQGVVLTSVTPGSPGTVASIQLSELD